MLLEQYSRHAHLGQLSRKRIRRSGTTPGGHRLWAPSEEEIIRRYYPDFGAMLKHLPGRSYFAIRARGRVLNVAKKRRSWLAVEVMRLRRNYATSTRQELQALFPEFSWLRIISKVRRMKLTKKKRGLKCTEFLVIDEIRSRCTFLNLSMVDLDDMARTRFYFQKAQWHGKNKLHAENVRRAVEALDGQLSVVWSDDKRGSALALIA